MKILCLHLLGFRNNGSFLRKQTSKRDAALFAQFDMGKLLEEYPPIKLFGSISGTLSRDPGTCDVAYKDAIKVKSVHFIGDKDLLKLPAEELVSAFDNPLIVRHPKDHTVPILDEVATSQLRNWIRLHPLRGLLYYKYEDDGEKALEVNQSRSVEAFSADNCTMRLKTSNGETETVKVTRA